jgi:hypothetical protein
VAPTDPLPVVRYDMKAGECSLDLLRWGLVYFAVWYVLAIVAYILIGIETRGRTIEELDATIARPKPLAARPG